MSFFRSGRKRRPNNRVGSTRLSSEGLERRDLLTLLGIDADFPTIDYNVDGDVAYDSTSDTFSVNGTPTLFTPDETALFPSFFFSGDVAVNIVVDDAGSLVGGTPGDDFVLTGDLDIDGDFIVDFSGTLLTGEITAFGFEEAGATDNYDFRFTITGGLIAGEYAGQDLGMTTTSESSTFAGDFGVDFTGLAKGLIGGVGSAVEPVFGLDIEKLTNGVDADDPTESPEIAAGETVTVTYLVTNTGDTALAFDQIEVVDDNGTPLDDSDDYSPTLVAASDVGGDLVLSAGETWTYEFVTTAEDLTVAGEALVIDFDTDGAGNALAAGTVVDDEYASIGVTVTSSNASEPPMIFDTANPTGGDDDLATAGYGLNNDTPLGNVLIRSEDGDSSDPDDSAKAGTLTFTFDEAVVIESVDILDIDYENGFVEVFDAADNSLGKFFMADLGDNSLQTVTVDVAGVTRMDVFMSSSGAVAEVKARRADSEGIFRNVATATAVVDAAVVASDADESGYVNPEPVVPATPTATLVEDVYVQNGSVKDNHMLRVEDSRRRDRVTFLQFDVSGLEGQGVESALLELTVTTDPGRGKLMIFEGVSSDWSEDTIDGDNPPEAGQLLDTVDGTFRKGDTVTFDVSNAISEDGIITLVLMIDEHSNDVAFGSSESGKPPKLTVTADGVVAVDEAFADLP